MSDDQFERWWIWSEMTSHASQITQTSSKQKCFLHEKILLSYVLIHSRNIEPDGPALKSDSDGLDPFQGTTKRLLIEYFRLFWIFSKRWRTNRITLNNTQYSKLLNFTQIGFRTKYPHKGIWSKSNCGTHCGVEPFERSEHMRTIQENELDCIIYEYRLFGASSWNPTTCRLTKFNDKGRNHISPLEMKYQDIQSSPRNALKDSGFLILWFSLIIWHWRSYRQEECHL